MEQEPHLEQRPTADDGDRQPEPASPQESIERPAELMRLAHMVQSTLNEARQLEVDEGGRQRLSDIYNRTVTELRTLVSEDLQDELDDVAVTPLRDDPSADELRIAQAQLVGWLQGLFQGIQASMASQATGGQRQQELQQSGPTSGGQYL